MNQDLLNMLDLTEADFEKPEVSREEHTEAQALYTAIMTDTLLEEDVE